MRRKRTVKSILDDHTKSTAEDSKDFKIITKKRRLKVPCFCDKYNGALVRKQTKKKHKVNLHSEYSLPTITPEDEIPLPIADETHSPTITPNETPIEQVLIKSPHLLIERQLTQTNSDTETYEEQIISFLLRKKRVRTGTFQPNGDESLLYDIYDSDESSEDSTDDKNDDAVTTKFLMFLRITHIQHSTQQTF